MLELDAATNFVLDADGRIERENDPDGSSGPLLYFAGCPSGNVVYLRRDVPTVIADAILTRVQREQPWFDEDRLPICLPELVTALSSRNSVEVAATALIYELPRKSASPTCAHIVSSDSDEGVDLLSRISRDGVPSILSTRGF